MKNERKRRLVGILDALATQISVTSVPGYRATRATVSEDGIVLVSPLGDGKKGRLNVGYQSPLPNNIENMFSSQITRGNRYDEILIANVGKVRLYRKQEEYQKDVKSMNQEFSFDFRGHRNNRIVFVN